MNIKLLIALGVSLALNFIFIGFESSRMYYQPCHRVPPARPEFMPRPMDGHELPMLQKTFKDAFKNHGKEMKEAMKNVKAALKKEPFDAELFKDALKKAAEVRQTVDAAVQESMIETISKMSPEERHRFAKQFELKSKTFKHKKGMERKRFKRHDEKRREALPPPDEESGED